ncbi:MAG: helix-turn-helix domain-containing protein [Treponema sp.]|jgi:transcriptional regulator with XRE-family HTH domain|nr:helix-turn-helix domain-containing protein [Treponema sp.]
METNFRKNLRAELDYLGLTVKELSAKTGIAKGTLDSYLGVRASMPPADLAVKIAGALGVSVEYLVSGEKEKVPFPVYDHTFRSIMRIIPGLDKKDNEVILELAKTFKKRAGTA